MRLRHRDRARTATIRLMVVGSLVAALGTVAAGAADAAPASADTLTAGQQLTAGRSLISVDGRYSATLQSDGNFVVYGPSGAGWNTGGSSADHIVMQADGNLAAYSASGSPTWSSGTATSHDDRLIMQNDGNLVIYSGNGIALWSNGARIQGGDTLRVGQQLTTGQTLFSTDGRYSATLQSDGNFVVYGPSGAGWNTGGGSADHIVMQADGNLVAYNRSGGATWSSGTSPSSGNSLTVQNDGNLVIYNGSGTALWSNGAFVGGNSSAVSWARSHNGQVYGTAAEQPAGAHQWSGYCWTFVFDAFGGKVPRQDTAQAGWNYYRSKGMTHADGSAPPAGSIAFWSWGSDGHAAVAVDNGQTIGTRGSPTDRYAVYQAAFDDRGLTYLGWVTP